MRETQRNNFCTLYSFLGYAIFGFSFLFSKTALAVASPFVLLAVRFTVAFVILNLLLLSGKFRLCFHGKRLMPLFVLGLIQPVVYFIFENYGVKLLATSFVGIMLSLVPIVSVVFASLILGERARAVQILCALVSIAGVCLTTLGQTLGSFSLLGFLLLLGAVCATSLFNVLSRKSSHDFTAFERTYAMFALGCIVFWGFALVQCSGHFHQMLIVPLTNANFWICIAYLSGVSSVGAFLMLNYAMTHIDVARVSIYANVTTVISILAGVLVLHERFGIFEIMGSLIILLSVFGMNRAAQSGRILRRSG